MKTLKIERLSKEKAPNSYPEATTVILLPSPRPQPGASVSVPLRELPVTGHGWTAPLT